jgi:hypothetical protein
VYRCYVCKFEVPLDDVVLRLGESECVCVRCYEREVKDEKPVTKRMQRDVNEE